MSAARLAGRESAAPGGFLCAACGDPDSACECCGGPVVPVADRIIGAHSLTCACEDCQLARVRDGHADGWPRGSASLFGCLLLLVLVASAWVILDAFPRGFGVEPWALVAFYGSVACAVAGALARGLRGRP